MTIRNLGLHIVDFINLPQLAGNQVVKPMGGVEREVEKTNRSSRVALTAILATFLILITSACSDSKNEPKLGSAPVVVNVSIDTTMTQWQVYNTESRASSTPLLRCKLQAVNADMRIIASETHLFQAGDPLTTTFNLRLPSGGYSLLAWCDYVDPASPNADLHYATADLTDVTLAGDYDGNDHSRNAYSGMAPIDFTVYEGDTTTVITSDVALKPIMGMIKFVATDYNQFLVKPLSVRVMVAYPGFLPHRYSVLRGVPFDATTGIYFITNELTELSTEGDGRATLGYDYVMVNGDESTVTVALGLYNDEGKLVGQTGNLNIPIRRGGITTVEGHFLTKTQSSGGIGIDPSFGGDFNIYY